MSRLFHARRRLREKLGDKLGEVPSAAPDRSSHTAGEAG
jgi:hypothetical protein